VQVKVPHVDWFRAFQDSPSTYSYSMISKGYDKFYFGNGLEVRVRRRREARGHSHQRHRAARSSFPTFPAALPTSLSF